MKPDPALAGMFLLAVKEWRDGHKSTERLLVGTDSHAGVVVVPAVCDSPMV